MSFTRRKREKRVRGIEPPCAAWEAAVLPLNYTRNAVLDFRFSIADCNQNKRQVVSCGSEVFRESPCARQNSNHCQEITSSAKTPVFLSPPVTAGGPLPSKPTDQLITP